MATVYEQNLANLSRDLGIPSLNIPKISSNPFSNIFGGQDPSSMLSSSMGIPQGVGMSVESSIPIGNGSAQNSAQSAQKEQSNLQKAFNSVQALYSPTGGRPIAGSEDVKVKADAYGRPYTVVDVSPREHRDMSGNLVANGETQSFGIDKNAQSKVGWQGPHSWEYGSDMARDVQNATNAAAATEVPKIIAEQKARGEKIIAMGFDPTTRELPYDYDRTADRAAEAKDASNEIMKNTDLYAEIRGKASAVNEDIKNKNFRMMAGKYGYGYGGNAGQLPKYPKATSMY